MNLTESTAGLLSTYAGWGVMCGDGSSSAVKRLAPGQQMDLHSLSSFRLGYCVVSQYLQAIILQVAGPYEHVSQHGWLTWEWSCMVTLTRRSWLLFSPCLCCLSWQIPDGKEERAEFLLPAFNASVVTHQITDSCGAAIKKSVRYSCYSNCDFSIQLHSMVYSDFMADGMYVSQSFLCLLLTRKRYKTHLVT